MPESLKWIAGLLAFAVAATPVTLYVQRLETLHAARTTAIQLTGGDPDAGQAAISRYGCGACHQIPRVAGAQGQVGPSLKGLATRPEIAGRLSNDPQNMIRWVRFPQQVSPGCGMPDLGVTEKDGRDIAAYLYTLR